MKFLSCLLLLIPVCLHAQTDRSWGEVFTAVKLSAYAGKKFKLEAAIKAQTTDSASGAAMLVRVFNTKREIIAHYNLNDQLVKSSNWGVYTINGKIGKDPAYMICSASFSGRGIYYYD